MRGINRKGAVTLGTIIATGAISAAGIAFGYMGFSGQSLCSLIGGGDSCSATAHSCGASCSDKSSATVETVAAKSGDEAKSCSSAASCCPLSSLAGKSTTSEATVETVALQGDEAKTCSAAKTCSEAKTCSAEKMACASTCEEKAAAGAAVLAASQKQAGPAACSAKSSTCSAEKVAGTCGNTKMMPTTINVATATKSSCCPMQLQNAAIMAASTRGTCSTGAKMACSTSKCMPVRMVSSSSTAFVLPAVFTTGKSLDRASLKDAGCGSAKACGTKADAAGCCPASKGAAVMAASLETEAKTCSMSECAGKAACGESDACCQGKSASECCKSQGTESGAVVINAADTTNANNAEQCIKTCSEKAACESTCDKN